MNTFSLRSYSRIFFSFTFSAAKVDKNLVFLSQSRQKNVNIIHLSRQKNRI